MRNQKPVIKEHNLYTSTQRPEIVEVRQSREMAEINMAILEDYNGDIPAGKAG
jgi:hypothetical protein